MLPVSDRQLIPCYAFVPEFFVTTLAEMRSAGPILCLTFAVDDARNCKIARVRLAIPRQEFNAILRAIDNAEFSPEAWH